MKIVIIGFGSIGQRHTNNLLSNEGHTITLFREKNRGNDLGLDEIYSYDDILKVDPDFVLVANPTAKHFKVLEYLMKHQRNILCEKPLVASIDELNRLEELNVHYSGLGRTAFNMRYHPVVNQAAQIIEKNTIGNIKFARFEVGQYLPDWRPDIDHLKNYSANKDMGGGVVLDLIHEIDLANYLVGNPDGEVKSIVERVSSVTNDTEDIAEIIYKTKNQQIVSIHLDYLYRGYNRNFLVCGSHGNISGDLFANKLSVTGISNNSIEEVSFDSYDKNQMYSRLIEDYINELQSGSVEKMLPSFTKSFSTMRTALNVKKEFTNE